MARPTNTRSHILPDRLAPNLKAWFVGTAAGPMSAAVGAYYAHPSNRFWPTLHKTGITPRLFAPHDYPELLDLRLGLTDFCKTSWGVDADITRDQFDVTGFRRKVARLKPQALAFTSKTAAYGLAAPPVASIMEGRNRKTRRRLPSSSCPRHRASRPPTGLSRRGVNWPRSSTPTESRVRHSSLSG